MVWGPKRDFQPPIPTQVKMIPRGFQKKTGICYNQKTPVIFWEPPKTPPSAIMQEEDKTPCGPGANAHGVVNSNPIDQRC